MNKDRFKTGKRDYLFLLGIGAIILIIFIYVNVLSPKKAGYVEVTIDGKGLGVYPLYEDGVFDLSTDKGENILVIKDGYAYMDKANCPDHTCIRQGKIHNTNETICCLPHRLIIRAVNTHNNGVDTFIQ